MSAELINAVDGSAQWSERYDRPYKDLFALQDEITHAVAGALKGKLLETEAAVPQGDRPPSGNRAAYNALLQGKFYAMRDTEADYRKSIEYFTAATKLDPRYGMAWSWLSRDWANLAFLFLGGNDAQQAYAAYAGPNATTCLALVLGAPVGVEPTAGVGDASIRFRVDAARDFLLEFVIAGRAVTALAFANAVTLPSPDAIAAITKAAVSRADAALLAAPVETPVRS